jgi:signal transduction histidine kinase
MRRRLTLALLAMVVATVVLTTAGSLLLIHRSNLSSEESELVGQTKAAVVVLKQPLLNTTTTIAPPTPRRQRALARRRAAARKLLALQLKSIGNYRNLELLSVGADGTLTPLPPPPLTQSLLQPETLLQGTTVSGNVDGIVFAAVPFADSTGATEVLLGTRRPSNPVSGVGYFLIVAAIVVVLSAVVAATLARRISRPLVHAVETTQEIATGNLQAQMTATTHDYPELQDLAAAINAMAASLNRARGLERQFLLSVSHELRTPLTSIRGYAEAISEGATDDVQGAVRVIETEARRLERLVQDLLLLARLDARQFSLDMQPVDVEGLISETVEGFRPEAAVQGVELTAWPSDRPPVVATVDPDRLRQILANLVENALKFASTRVDAGITTDATSVALWVADDGPGIPSAELPRVFDRHYRSDRTSPRRVGTGLGLAIVAELSTAMGARILAESPIAPGGGTRMTVQFPLRGLDDGATTAGTTPRGDLPAAAT